jgi:hypothetical protein
MWFWSFEIFCEIHLQNNYYIIQDNQQNIDFLLLFVQILHQFLIFHEYFASLGENEKKSDPLIFVDFVGVITNKQTRIKNN